MTDLILASTSTARARMLDAAGVKATAMPAHIDEAAIKAAMQAENAPPRDIADKLAELKALRVSARAPQAIVLGADQVLVFGDKIIDKAKTRDEAASRLAMLAGGTHHLLAAVVAARGGAPIWRHIGTARITMRSLSPEFIASYLDQAGDDVLGSVGCYQAEGLGAQLLAGIEGDYFSVLGLPLLPVLDFLRTQGVLAQ